MRVSLRTRVALGGLALVFVYVGWQATQTLVALDRVEAERDSWQRPDDIIHALGVSSGDTVVDLGSGAGYFSIRLAPVVGPTGRVVAIDVLRQPLVFLWMRSLLRREWQIDVVHATQGDPHLPPYPLDAVLIVNTYHELSDPRVTLSSIVRVLKGGGRLVVADRRSREDGTSADDDRARHRLSPRLAEEQIREAGFRMVSRDDRFIDRAGDDPWWLLVVEKP